MRYLIFILCLFMFNCDSLKNIFGNSDNNSCSTSLVGCPTINQVQQILIRDCWTLISESTYSQNNNELISLDDSFPADNCSFQFYDNYMVTNNDDIVDEEYQINLINGDYIISIEDDYHLSNFIMIGYVIIAIDDISITLKRNCQNFVGSDNDCSTYKVYEYIRL